LIRRPYQHVLQERPLIGSGRRASVRRNQRRVGPCCRRGNAAGRDCPQKFVTVRGKCTTGVCVTCRNGARHDKSMLSHAMFPVSAAGRSSTPDDGFGLLGGPVNSPTLLMVRTESQASIADFR
jgi:hypothetical protein